MRSSRIVVQSGRGFLVATTMMLGGASCSGLVDADTTSQVPPAAIAAAYLDQVIGIMRTNSMNRLRIDWTAFERAVHGAAGNAQTVADTYPAIRVALGLLSDGHSSFRTREGNVLFVPVLSCSAPSAARPVLPATIGYVRVRAFSGSQAESDAFAQRLQDSIVANDRDGLVGWIVDLRGNTGGNMWPMIAGIGPILGETSLGYFIGPTGMQSHWEYRAGASVLNGTPVVTMPNPIRLRRENPRVAVLTDNLVASSGEAVAISFRKRPDTRTFGMATCGLSTANSPFPLPDGALLNLTTAVMADRTKVEYGKSIPPDETIVDENGLAQRAVSWLLTGQ